MRQSRKSINWQNLKEGKTYVGDKVQWEVRRIEQMGGDSFDDKLAYTSFDRVTGKFVGASVCSLGSFAIWAGRETTTEECIKLETEVADDYLADLISRS